MFCNMSGRGRGVKRNRRGDRRQPKEEKVDSDRGEVDTSSPVIQAFLGYQSKLDTKHDKHERLVKLSRDVTIESKRIIFLLHRMLGRESEREGILKEAKEKLSEVEDVKWRAIANELQHEEPYQFLRAYSPGLQEYIEALSFYHYLLNGTLITLPEVEDRLKFKPKPPKETQQCEGEHSSEKIETPPSGDGEEADPGSMSATQASLEGVHVPPVEYVLGVADLTGELMRLAINCVGNGDLEQPNRLCNFIRDIHDGFVSFGNSVREVQRKLNTLRQSLRKVEMACYTLQVRGSEIPKHMLTEIFSAGAAQERSYDDSVTLDE